MTQRRPTVARGAVIERSLVQRWISRQMKNVIADRVFVAGGTAALKRGYIAGLLDLQIWLKNQPTRTKRKGGIGRQ